MRTWVVIATLVLLVLVLSEARPGRPGRGRGGRGRPGPGNAGPGRRPRPGGRRPGPSGRRPPGRRPRPPPAFEFAKWKRQVPFNETVNLNAKEAAKYNQTKGLIFFTSSDGHVLRKTEFSQANTILDFSTEKMAIKTFTSDGLACFITDTLDTLNNTIDKMQSYGNSTMPVALGDNYVRRAIIYTGDLSTDAGQLISNFCSQKICKDSITVYQLLTSIIVNIDDSSIPCLEGQYRCANGDCVLGTECDGVPQCSDGSDESRCDTSTSSSTSEATTSTEATTTTAEATTTTSENPTTTAGSTTTSATTTGSPGEESDDIKVTSVYGYFTITIRN